MDTSEDFTLSFVAQYNKRPTPELKQMMKDFARKCLTNYEYKRFLSEIEKPSRSNVLEWKGDI